MGCAGLERLAVKEAGGRGLYWVSTLQQMKVDTRYLLPGLSPHCLL